MNASSAMRKKSQQLAESSFKHAYLTNASAAMTLYMQQHAYLETEHAATALASLQEEPS